MKKGVLLLSLVASLGLVGCSDSSDADKAPTVKRQPLSIENSPQYLAVIKCVDDQLYKGAKGYDRSVRKAILNDALALYALPRFDKKKVANVDRTKMDMKQYMASYSDCSLSEDFSSRLNAFAVEHDYEFPEED